MQFCGKCLEIDLIKRYANAASLLGDLQRLSEGKPVEARKVSVLEQVWLRSRRNKTLSIALASSATLALFLRLFFYWQNTQLRQVVTLGGRFLQGVKERRYRSFYDLLAESLDTTGVFPSLSVKTFGMNTYFVKTRGPLGK